MKLSSVFLSLFLLAFLPFICAGGETLTFSTISGIAFPKSRIDVLKEVYKQLGFQLKIVYYPGERALLNLSQGKVDGEVARMAGIEKKYPNLIRIPIPIVSLEIAIFSKKYSFPVEGVKSLSGYKIGILRGIKFSENLTQNSPRLVVDSPRTLFQVLHLDRVDLVLFLALEGQIEIRKQNLQKEIKMLSPPLFVLKGYHYLHKKHEKLALRVTAVLEGMEKDGSLLKLIERSEEEVLETWENRK